MRTPRTGPGANVNPTWIRAAVRRSVTGPANRNERHFRTPPRDRSPTDRTHRRRRDPVDADREPRPVRLRRVHRVEGLRRSEVATGLRERPRPCRSRRSGGPGRGKDGDAEPDRRHETASHARSLGAVAPRIVVVGSINLDLVARCDRLPRPGETVSGAELSRVPGGKGANQAVACARLGAEVTLIGAVGKDGFADEALTGLREAGVELSLATSTEPTGVALIYVDGAGDNQIVVAPGANWTVGEVELEAHEAVLCQLEIPDETVLSAWEQCTGLFCLNAAPSRPIGVDPDLTVVNRYELEAVSRRDGLVAVTHGAEGASLLEDGEEIARAAPPQVEAVDGTAAGDAFTACLLVSFLEGREPQGALERACAAGAIAASRFGAQPSLPTADEIDAILT